MNNEPSPATIRRVVDYLENTLGLTVYGACRDVEADYDYGGCMDYDADTILAWRKTVRKGDRE